MYHPQFSGQQQYNSRRDSAESLNQQMNRRNTEPISQEHGSLFWSAKCSNCKLVMDYMKKIGVANNFSLICVDRNPAIPPTIQRVPTLLLKKGYKIVVGKNSIISALEENYNLGYSQNIAQNRNNSNFTSQGGQHHSQNNGGMQREPEIKLEACNENAIGNWDMIDDTPNSKKAAEKTVFDMWDQFQIPEPPKGMVAERASKSVDIDAYMAARDSEIQLPPRR